jgi:hypothetical protein
MTFKARLPWPSYGQSPHKAIKSSSIHAHLLYSPFTDTSAICSRLELYFHFMTRNSRDHYIHIFFLNLGLNNFERLLIGTDRLLHN